MLCKVGLIDSYVLLEELQKEFKSRSSCTLYFRKKDSPFQMIFKINHSVKSRYGPYFLSIEYVSKEEEEQYGERLNVKDLTEIAVVIAKASQANDKELRILFPTI
jgi:hypothetical protein